MAIKNKDGTVYKLTGTNPVMRTQENWDTSKIKLINMQFGSEIVKDKENPVEKFKSDFNVLNISEKLNLVTNDTYIPAKDFIQEIEEIQEEPVKEPVRESVKEPIKEKPKVLDDVEKMFKKNGLKYYCAPAIGTVTHMDSLYGSVYETTKYGDAFTFDAIIVDQSDLQLQIWSLREITVNSIIYLKEGAERWWRIYESTSKSGGYLSLAAPSDSNPDFS